MGATGFDVFEETKGACRSWSKAPLKIDHTIADEALELAAA